MQTYAEELSERAPCAVPRPVMYQNWERLTFLHWPYRADRLRGLLPEDIEVDTFDNTAWLGLTPFEVTRLRPPGLPALPWLSRFPEMNLRTYVRGPDGERGIWFFTLEASRLAAVIGARLSYGLPYRWGRMSVRAKRDRMEYSSRRYWRGATAHLVVRPGLRVEADALERFLTARFRLYTKIGGRLAFAQVEHEPWPLFSAEVLRLEQSVTEASGFHVRGEPLVHYSPGVHTRIGRPVFV